MIFPVRFKIIVYFFAVGVTVVAGPLEYSAVQTANPLKGFMPFAGKRVADALPHSMEFTYMALKDLMDGAESFTWEKLDKRLNEVAGRGRHSVIRVFMDYPRNASGVPDFLRHGPDGISGTADDLLVRSYDEHGNKGVSVSPDYADPHLRGALRNFISAFGARYDGDPRIGFIQIGLLGFWGEWHTYPHEGWMPPLVVQEEILGAYDEAFSRTRLLVRSPKAASFRNYNIGYHDDSFAFSTLAPPSWHFGGRLAKFGESERWRTEPIGGEIRPENQPYMWEDPMIVPAGQDFEKCVAEIRPSWMLAHGAFVRKLSAAARERAEKQARMLGYEFHITEALVVAGTADDPVRVGASLRNTGVAPFYYDWAMEIVVVGDENQFVHQVRPGWGISGLLPGDPDRSWSHTVPAGVFKPGAYTVLVRAINPLDGGMPLRFANTTQDADVVGWLSLGNFRIEVAGVR